MIGTTISHYRIDELLGTGGMGSVFKAKDQKLKRTVALKFLPPDATRNAEAKARFVNEAQTASSLDHPNICTIYEIDETDDGQLFIAMACYEGETLADRLTGSPLPLNEAIDIASQVATGLDKAHEQGIVHRDIKPANIFLTLDDQVKILDFGLAKLAGQANLTRDGETVGTVAYMSPEQAQGKKVDQRSDIWSLGAVLYEMVTGLKPFAGEHEQAVIHSIINSTPEPVTVLRAGAPPELDQVIAKCLEKDPSQRYQTSEELQDALQQARKAVTGTARLVSPQQLIQPRKRRMVRAATVAATTLFVAVLVFIGFRVGDVRDILKNQPAPAIINSIAVLPFENLSEDPEAAYLGDEMPASINSNLAEVQQLRVVPRSSAFRFRGANQDLDSVHRDLKVGAVLTGDIRVRGDQVSVRAELVDPVNDRQLWGQRYTGDLDDIQELEERITAQISEALKLQLTSAQRDRLVLRHTDSPQAHQLYLKGRYYWSKRTEADLQKAIALFEQAIAEDPEFTLAYTGLADVHLVREIVPPRETMEQARIAAEKALGLDASLAPAHATLASVALHYEWDFEKAEAGFKRAIALDPNYATARQWYALFLTSQQRYPEAMTQIQRAQELDPLSALMNVAAAWIFYFQGDIDQAVIECDNTLELDPDFTYAQYLRGKMYGAQGKYAEALAELDRALVLQGRNDRAYITAEIGRIYGITGREQEARQELRKLEVQAEAGYLSRYHFVVIHTALNDHDQAFQELEVAFEDRDTNLVYLNCYLDMEPLRADPRFDELLQRVGLQK